MKKNNGCAMVVQQQIDAYNQKDIHQFLSYYTDDITIMDYPNNEIVLSGKQELEQVYKDVFDQSPTLFCDILDRMVFDNKVIDSERITGRKGADPIEVVSIYEIKNQLISKIYFLRKG